MVASRFLAGVHTKAKEQRESLSTDLEEHQRLMDNDLYDIEIMLTLKQGYAEGWAHNSNIPREQVKERRWKLDSTCFFKSIANPRKAAKRSHIKMHKTSTYSA